MEKLQVLLDFVGEFLPCKKEALAPNVAFVFHGTRVDVVDAVVANGPVAVRSTDSGYFGCGVYATLNIDYAARYARGDFDTPFPTVRRARADGAYPVVLLAMGVGLVYPNCTPAHD